MILNNGLIGAINGAIAYGSKHNVNMIVYWDTVHCTYGMLNTVIWYTQAGNGEGIGFTTDDGDFAFFDEFIEANK